MKRPYFKQPDSKDCGPSCIKHEDLYRTNITYRFLVDAQSKIV